MMRDCRHENIVAYLGSYLRYFLQLSSSYVTPVLIIFVHAYRILILYLLC